MPWRVELSSQATRSYKRLPPSQQERIARALDTLERDPRPPGKGVKALRGRSDAFLRYRVGDYRVLYEIHDGVKVVLILGIVHRRDLEGWLRRQR